MLIIEMKFICNCMIIIISDDVCCNIRNVRFIVMQFKQLFVTAVCVLLLYVTPSKNVLTLNTLTLTIG